MIKGAKLLCGTLAASLLAAAPLAAQERAVTLQAQQGLSITLYQDDLALVHDNRWVPLVQGENRLAIAGVSDRLIGGSLALQAEEEGLRILEQSLRPADLTPHELLRRAVGQQVRLVTQDEDGGERSEAATLLSMAAGPVLRVGERIEIDPPGRIVLLDLPEGLHAEPQLGMAVQTESDGPQELAFAYLTRGLSWEADYVATLDAEEDRLTLEGWATLANDTQAPYRRAHLRLVAGSVAQSAPEGAPRNTMLQARAESAVAFDSMPAPEAVSDRYLFDTGREVDLLPGERKRVGLFRQEGIAVERSYRFEGLVTAGGQERRGPVSAGLHLTFTNEGEPARPLPAGTLRVYEPVAEGPSLFAGETRISHTPVDGELALRLGEAFDVTATMRQTAFERLSDSSYETAGEVTIRNAKTDEVTVEVVGQLPQGARILEESAPHDAESVQRPVWTLSVPAEGETTLTYGVRVNR